MHSSEYEGVVLGFGDEIINPLWKDYYSDNFFDEMIASDGMPRNASKGLYDFFNSIDEKEMQDRRIAGELAIREMGVSFTVYSADSNTDRDWPFDVIPRTIEGSEWDPVSESLKQRSRALNEFIHDVYNEQRIFADGIIPSEIVLKSPNFKSACLGMSPPFRAWAHICGTDLVRDTDGEFYVLEDNLRVPSGVAYMLENREVTKRILPELFEHYDIRPVDDYPLQLYKMLASLSPRKNLKPTIVVLTPGIFNSAYFEHAFLAHSMGAELVEGGDLFVDDHNIVFKRTIDGAVRVDVVYRRIDDDFIDPEVFRPDSMVGVPGIMRAWRDNNVAIANAPGSGVADDKVIYSFVPEMIRYYLDEEPTLASVETYLCMNEADRIYVLNNIERLVVKPANESGGQGVLIGPHSNREEKEKCKESIAKQPRNYIAQPTLSLSTAPTYVDGKINPRHLDLRPFILHGRDIWVTPGGLTRVALKRGSLVVNSSQGGGSKDTWIVELKE